VRLYLAAPLFTVADRAFNTALTEALEKDGHSVYLPQRDTPHATGAGRTTTIFHANLAALALADAVAVCEGSQVDDGTAWEIGYAYSRNMRVYGLRTDTRIVQQPDERINLMILESLDELAPSVEVLRETLRRADHPS
jgi:nucleoside 2-deoxyribosyltransferase